MATVLDLARFARPKRARVRKDAIVRAIKSMGISIIYSPTHEVEGDVMFTINVNGRATDWSVIVRRDSTTIQRTAGSVSASWDYGTTQDAFDALPGLMRVEGY